MVKILPKIRSKRKKVQGLAQKDDPSVGNSTKTSRRSANVEPDDDERTAPMQDTPASTRGRRDKQKTPRHDKLAAQKLAKERERTARAAAALDEKGNKLFERGYFDKAMVCYSKALKMKRRTFTNILEEADDIDDKLEKKLSKYDSQVLVSMATSINNIGYLRQRSGEASTVETMAAYQKSLKIKRRILGNESLSVGKTLNNIGSVYYLTRDFDGALNAYREAMNIMKSNLGEHHPDIATVMSNMGDVYLANGQDENSLEQYRSALNIRYAHFGKHDARVVRLLEKIARIEIGDKMIPQGTDIGNADWEEHALTDLGMRPLSAEYQILNGELKADIEYMDQLQQRMSENMDQDKVVIIQKMKSLPQVASFDESEGGSYDMGDDTSQESGRDEPETYNHEESQETVYDPSSPTKTRIEAIEHVNYRLEKLRSLRSTKSENEAEDERTTSHENFTGTSVAASVSTVSSNELYSQLYGELEHDDKSATSEISEELYGQLYGTLQPQSEKMDHLKIRQSTSSINMNGQQKRVIVTS